MSSASPPSPSCAATASAPSAGTGCTPARSRAIRSSRSRSTTARRWPPATTSARCPTASGRTCRAPTGCWAPTASGAATGGARCGASSRSTATTWRSPRWRRWGRPRRQPTRSRDTRSTPTRRHRGCADSPGAGVPMSDVIEVRVPDIGDFTDVPVIEVLVAAGEEVVEEAPLVTLESDKATMDVPAPAAGVVQELLVKVGDTVSEGTPILTLAAVADAPVEAAVAAEASTESAAPRAAAPAAPPPRRTDGDAVVYASPSVRRLARELKVDLAGLQGSGRKGRITKEDVQAAAGAGPAAVREPASADGAVAALGLAPWPKVDFAKYGPIERVPLSRIKRISGPNLARNWVMIPHVTQHDEADITALEAFRKSLNAEQADVKVTMVALLIKAVVASLHEFGDFNSSLDGGDLVLKRYYNIGFAADTPQGLVVPVIKDADKKGLIDIALELTDLSSAARDGKLKPADMSGGTFSISSLGGIGGTAFTPIVNAPEVAILGVSRSAMKPVWNGTEFEPRLMLPLSLSYDHRVIDGAAAARFCVHLGGVLMDLRRALL